MEIHTITEHNRIQAETFCQELRQSLAPNGSVHPNPLLKRIRFLTNVTDGFKYVAVMETETIHHGKHVLSAWLLHGSLSQLVKILDTGGSAFTTPEVNLGRLKPKLPVISLAFWNASSFRCGGAKHVATAYSFDHARQVISNYAEDYLKKKRKRGYVFPNPSAKASASKLLESLASISTMHEEQTSWKLTLPSTMSEVISQQTQALTSIAQSAGVSAGEALNMFASAAKAGLTASEWIERNSPKPLKQPSADASSLYGAPRKRKISFL